MARMGLCFSTSIDSVGIEISQGTLHDVEDDVKTDDQKYFFSDGVGRISQELAKEVTWWIIGINTLSVRAYINYSTVESRNPPSPLFYSKFYSSISWFIVGRQENCQALHPIRLSNSIRWL